MIMCFDCHRPKLQVTLDSSVCEISASVSQCVCVFVQVRGTEASRASREEVDTALLKLYAEQDHESLLDLLASDNTCLLADSSPWLEKHSKYV